MEQTKIENGVRTFIDKEKFDTGFKDSNGKPVMKKMVWQYHLEDDGTYFGIKRLE